MPRSGKILGAVDHHLPQGRFKIGEHLGRYLHVVLRLEAPDFPPLLYRLSGEQSKVVNKASRHKVLYEQQDLASRIDIRSRSSLRRGELAR